MTKQDIKKELKRINDTMKSYNFTLGKGTTKFIILDPKQIIKKTKHQNTSYWYFECEMLSKDDEIIPEGRHTIQLPTKRVIYPLFSRLLKQKMLDKPVKVTIKRIKKSIFDIIID